MTRNLALGASFTFHMTSGDDEFDFDVSIGHIAKAIQSFMKKNILGGKTNSFSKPAVNNLCVRRRLIFELPPLVAESCVDFMDTFWNWPSGCGRLV